MACCLGLVIAACGDDDDEDGTAATEAPDDASATTSADTSAETTDATGATTADTAGDTTATTADGGASGSGEIACGAVDEAFEDETNGHNAGRFVSDVQCGSDEPLAAEGDPIVVTVQNPEGDPNGSFPEFSLAVEAAVEYINTELGGLGADMQERIPGRPIQLEICREAISPDDSQRCANESVAKSPMFAVGSINFFGNHIPVYQAAGIPLIVASPVTIADFTSEDIYSIGGGGGCLGNHTGMVEFATNDLGGTRIAVPWADTPPGVVCYYDLEAKPLDVLKGTVEGDAERAGTIPDLEHIGVPIKPATPDVTPMVTQVLDFDPDVILFSAQGADCWNLVDGLGRLGWTPDQIPLVLSGACVDFEAMAAAGDLAKGIYFVGAAGSTFGDPETIDNAVDKFEAEIYQTKAVEYGLPEPDVFKGFAGAGWNTMLTIWETANLIVLDGGEVSGETIAEAFAATDGDHAFGSTPLSCSTAAPPYVAICNALVAATTWDGEKLVPANPLFTGVDLVAGTELKPGP